MAKVQNGVETVRKILIAWVGHMNVIYDRQTDDKQTDGWWHSLKTDRSSDDRLKVWHVKLVYKRAIFVRFLEKMVNSFHIELSEGASEMFSVRSLYFIKTSRTFLGFFPSKVTCMLLRGNTVLEEQTQPEACLEANFLHSRPCLGTLVEDPAAPVLPVSQACHSETTSVLQSGRKGKGLWRKWFAEEPSLKFRVKDWTSKRRCKWW